MPPKIHAEIRPIAQRYGLEVVHMWYEIAMDPEQSTKDRLAASELLAAYGYGKPRETHEHSGPSGGPIQIDTAKSELADALKQLLSAE